MSPNDLENQSDPELVIDIHHRCSAFTVEVRRGGKVRYLADGFKTRDEAWEAGRAFVKRSLRAWLQATTGVSVRAERPAFVVCGVPGCQRPREDGWPICRDCGTCTSCGGRCLPNKSGLCFGCFQVINPYNLQPVLVQPVLEDEQLCTCGHLDGVHEVLDGPCHGPIGDCSCEGFTPVAQVEAVSSEALS